MRELSRRAFPEPDSVPDDAPASIAAARAQRRRDAEKSRIAALSRARKERANRTEASVVSPQAGNEQQTA
jgi:hypothetical protein